MTIGKRIEQLLKQNKKTAAGLAKYLNTKPSTVSGWTNLGRSPSSDVILPICEYLNVSVYYLLTGKEENNKNKTLSEDSQLNPTEKIVLEAFRSTDEEGRARIIQVSLNEKDRAILEYF